MKKVYQGKTKDVFELENGNYLLKLKDDATGKDGVFDPGENAVGLTIEGLGRQSLKFSKYYFELLAQKGIPTHFVNCDIDEVTMTVKKASIFGKGLEFICRFKAVGSFIKRYGDYIEEGAHLNSFVEITLKDDNRLDPVISKDALIQLNIMNEKDFEEVVELTKKISKIIKDDLEKKDITLYDIKLEFGKVNNQIVLIDEISGGNMRAYKNNAPIDPMKLVDYVL